MAHLYQVRLSLKTWVPVSALRAIQEEDYPALRGDFSNRPINRRLIADKWVRDHFREVFHHHVTAMDWVRKKQEVQQTGRAR